MFGAPGTALPGTALPRTALPGTALPRTALPQTALPLDITGGFGAARASHDNQRTPNVHI